MANIKITVKTANEVYAALQNIDVYTQVIKDENGKDKSVTLPYKFSGKGRWNLTKALNKFRLINEDFIKTRDNIIKEASDGSGVVDQNDQEAIKEVTKKLEEVLDQEVDASGVLKIKIKDLNLDENPIPVAVLSLLTPILDETE
jgi:hypothetical protein